MEDKIDEIKRRVESYLQQANEYPDLYHVQNYILKEILKDILSLCKNQ